MKTARPLYLVALAALVLAAGSPVLADSGRSITEGRLDAVGPEGKPLGSCPLKHTDVKVDISGFIARVTVRQQFQNPDQPFGAGKRIEDPYLHIGMQAQGGQGNLPITEVHVVEEEPHPDAAIRGCQDAGDQQPTAAVAVPDEILEVQRSLGGVGQRQALQQGLAPGVEESHTRFARMGCDAGLEQLSEGGRPGPGESTRLWFFHNGR